jgi:hypothetical protein
MTLLQTWQGPNFTSIFTDFHFLSGSMHMKSLKNGIFHLQHMRCDNFIPRLVPEVIQDSDMKNLKMTWNCGW